MCYFPEQKVEFSSSCGLVVPTAPPVVADLGEGPGPPLFWVKKEELTEGRKAGGASERKPPPSFPPPSPLRHCPVHPLSSSQVLDSRFLNTK